ncbi:MAG: bifunctional 2-keto-4-hydroxyglutarate aldolase/2-keto-3-deoxy-6-phosphogluconate aldolase [Oscillospiraceae bacterium]
MLIKEDVIKRIKDDGVVAVVRAASESEAKGIVEKCVAGGLTSIELTFTVPFAHKIIESLAVSYGNQILLGAGTVLDSETARIAILSGANFIVSPHFNADTVRLCNRYRIATMAGIMTITEAVTAMEAGTDILKLFPGDLFSPNFIKSILAPLPQAQIMPTGGVDIENTAEWIKMGAVAVGVGGNLTKGDITENSRAFMNAVKAARK